MKRTFALILTLVIILSCAGCAEKTPQTLDGFTAIMEQAGFEVTDITDEYDTNGIEVTILLADNGDYWIEFYEFEKSSDAVRIYANTQAIAEKMNPNSHISVSMGSFGKYEYNVDTLFGYIARIENTMICCETDAEYKGEIKSLIETLGYN
jgi:hypothetical protein